ncbi:MAG TPA: NAD(P)-dependent oxidoreductase [Desulfitobacteriaceae bacterium]|nr:NAD(P)-dependent oxidoreductase [Desulfitobacteriaceae bacterium]
MIVTKEKTRLGFIGTGVMGKSMVSHLLKAGYKVTIYNRTRAKTKELTQQGAVWRDTVAEVAAFSNLIITMVGYPQDVTEIYLGSDGIIENACPGTYLIDMTTSAPSLARTIYDKALARGMFALDAPVSGGDIGAREAKLTIMAGGDQAVFEAVKPVLSCLGTNIILQGGAGAGQNTKMCNQIAVAATMIGVVEAMVYAEKAGLDPLSVLKSIGSGAAGSWSLTNYVPRIIAGNFAPGFYVKHFIKDMAIALTAAQEMGLKTPGLALAKSLYEQLASKGEENSGIQALYKFYLS